MCWIARSTAASSKTSTSTTRSVGAADSNRGACEYSGISRSMNLRNWFDTAFQLRPAEPALEWKGATYTFGDIDARSNRMARALQARGLSAATGWASIWPIRIEFIDLYLACVKLGVIFVPINILYREREMSHILSDAEPKLFVTEKELPALAARGRAAAGRVCPKLRSTANRPPRWSTHPAPPASPRARFSPTIISP